MPRLLGGRSIFGAALDPKARDLRAGLPKGAAVALGSEGSGLSTELLSMCAGLLRIPMLPGTESLNVSAAAAVIMWELSAF